MQKQLNTMIEALTGKTPSTVEALVQKTDHPFSMMIMSHPLPKKFGIPPMEPFDGSRDPFDHLETYKILMFLHDYLDGVIRRAFPATLKGSPWKWFNSLQPNSVNSFSELSLCFAKHFIGGRRYRRSATYLLNVKQVKGESLRDYVSRFNQEVMQVDDADEKVVLTAFMGGLLPTKFTFTLSKSPPNNMAELMLWAQKHMNIEDAMAARKNQGNEIRELPKRKKRQSTERSRGWSKDEGQYWPINKVEINTNAHSTSTGLHPAWHPSWVGIHVCTWRRIFEVAREAQDSAGEKIP